MSKKMYKGKCYELFWGGPFSNWFPSNFVVDGIEFNCGEQYMMYMKAKTFNDNEIADEILKENSPMEQKALGRKVKNYDDNTWNNVRYDIVKKGLLEKFKQNEFLKKYLLARKDCIIVEASPQDRIWGVGYAESNALENMDNWGQNLLGKELMDIAKEI